MSLPTVLISRVVATALVVVALAGCGLDPLTGARRWGSATGSSDGSSAEIVVEDRSGRLTNVEIDPDGVGPVMGISNPADAPNVVLVPWAGGACDTKTEIVFTSAGQALAGTMRTTTSGEVCDMMAIEHLLRLTSNAPLPADKVTLDPAP